MSTETFVTQLYQNFLFREPDEAGKNDWINRIESGDLSPAEITYNFAISEEYSERASSVSSLYFLLFGRVPDSDGMQYWLEQIDKGMSTDNLVGTFMRSQEYQNTYGSAESDTEFLQLLTQNGLNREAVSGDFNTWGEFLTSGGSRAAVIQSYATSAEFNQLHGGQIQQTSFYYGLLDRAPSDAELKAAPADPVELITALYNDDNYQGELLPPFSRLPLISVVNADTSTQEQDGTVAIRVYRSLVMDTECSVSYEISSSDASDGTDYIASSGTLSYAAGEFYKVIYVQLLNDEVDENTEQVSVRLSAPQNARLNEESSTAVVTIKDDDWQPLSTVQVSSLVQDQGVTIEGITSDDLIGSTLTSAGDMNGDGFADFIIGSNRWDQPSHYLIFGSAELAQAPPDLASLDGTNGVQILGDAFAVDDAGDINGDGYDDLIFGNRHANGTGQAYLMFGKAEGWMPTLSLSELDGTSGVLIDGITEYDSTGDSVAGAGDLNGDGIDDLVIGSPNAIPQAGQPLNSHGQVHVIYGHRGDRQPVFDLSQFDRTEATAIVGRMNVPMHFGYTLEGVGDMNGDGIDDLMVLDGGEFSRYGLLGDLRSFLIFGRSEGWDNPYFIGEREPDVATAIRIYGDDHRNPVEPAGDINGDGLADAIIGSSSWGASYVILGSAEPWPEKTGDNPESVINIVGKTGSRIGADVFGIGDINNDGYDDLLIAQQSSDASEAAGAYLLYGRADGWASNPLSESHLIRLDSRSGTNPDISLAGVGDVNGDGVPDFLIGDPGKLLDDSLEPGKVYLVFGSDQLFA